MAEVAAMLKAIHAEEDRAADRQKSEQVAAKEMKLADAAALLVAGIEETFLLLRVSAGTLEVPINNPLERLLREAPKDASGVGVPRWKISVDARRCTSAPQSRLEVGHATLHGDDSLGGSA